MDSYRIIGGECQEKTAVSCRRNGEQREETAMPFTSWRGTVGLIKPTMRPGNLEELIRMLPPGINVIPLFNDIREGSLKEFRDVLGGYEARVEILAQAGIDLIHPAGAPPFMVLGYAGETELVREWEARYKVSIFTSGMNHVAALRAVGAKRFVGVSYFRGDINASYAAYFTAAGFDVLAMAGMDVDFDKVQELDGRQVYRFVREVFLAHRDAEAIYMLGPAWHTADIIGMLEADFGVPVVHHTTALCWEIQKRLHVRQPVAGFGKLVAELP
jgi:maleate isomerase